MSIQRETYWHSLKRSVNLQEGNDDADGSPHPKEFECEPSQAETFGD